MMSGPSATDAAPIRVALVEDDRATREGLGLLIDGTPGFRCVGMFRSVEEALRAAVSRRSRTSLLLDIHLPGMLGSEGVRLFRDRYPAAQILMLTVYDEEDKRLRIDLQRRVRLSAEEDAAGPPARRDPRSARRRSADVTGEWRGR